MDFMFEDEVDEVGSDVEAYCPKCKADTTHVVISKYEDEIRRVQCNPCGDVHSYRKPRGEVEDDVPEPIAAKKRAMMKKLTWEEFFNKHPDREGKPYEFRENYSENIVVTHPKFGRGFVSEIMSDSKVEITFRDGRRVLVHNRRDMPGLPLAAEGDGIPSTGAKAKAKKAAAKESAAKDAAAAAKEMAAREAQAKEAAAAKVAPQAGKPPASKPPAAGNAVTSSGAVSASNATGGTATKKSGASTNARPAASAPTGKASARPARPARDASAGRAAARKPGKPTAKPAAPAAKTASKKKKKK
jgi:hypothetical protein